MSKMISLPALIGLLALTGCSGSTDAPDLILFNGKIVTLEEPGEVTALAARDGRIYALGTDAEIKNLAGPQTRTLDLAGRLAVPGFIEGHGHFTGIGRSLMNVDLRGATTWEGLIEIVARAAQDAAPGQWIVGWGWHQEKFSEPPPGAVEGYPTHPLLTRAVPDHPVLLKHAAGSHGGIANARALELARIDRETPDPPGGRIVRDAHGDPTGVLRESAYQLVRSIQERAESEMTAEQIARRERREIELADRECLSKGITSFQDAGSTFHTVDLLREVAESGELGVRLWVMIREDNDRLRQRIRDYKIIGAADGHLTVRAIKRSIDGALGTHGAWLLEPYEDLAHTAGLNTEPLDALQDTARIAMENDVQLCVHAIGDRGNRETLDIYERTFGEHPAKEDLRWRIEHAQHLSVEDIPRFAELGVIASMQGVHCTSDGPWVPKRLGRQRSEQGAYVWRKLIDSGAVVTNGTDAPIEDVSPIQNFYASVTRNTIQGDAFYPEQRMNRLEALRSYTVNAAYAAFEEKEKGSLAPGKLADITVLSQDILTVPDERLLDTEVVYTIVGGEVLYENSAVTADAG